MNTRPLKIETFFWIGALFLALTLRLAALGQAPLSEPEAGRALAALALTHGEIPAAVDQPGALLLAVLSFFILGASEFSARVPLALIGASLVLVPYFWRAELGRTAALIAAFGFALDPALVAASREFSGVMLGVVFFAWGLTAWKGGVPLWAGVCAGVALFAGPVAWWALLLLVLTWLVGARWLGLEPVFTPAAGLPPAAFRTASLALAGTLLFFGTLLGVAPAGLAALGSSLAGFFQGWLAPFGNNLFETGLALPAYQPLALILGVAAAITAWRRDLPLERWLSLALLLAFSLALIYPGRQPLFLVWAVLPAWVLAASELVRLLSPASEEPAVGWLMAGVILVLFLLTWLNLANMLFVISGTNTFWRNLALLVGVPVLGGLATWLVALGWSTSAARMGLALGVVAGLGLVTGGAVFSLARESANLPVEFWSSGAGAGQQAALLTTLADLSEWETGRRDSLEVVALNASASLRWQLRQFSAARFTQVLLPTELPPVIITASSEPEPQLSVLYRGQDFAWQQTASWRSDSPTNWLAWLLYRRAETTPESVILWVRSDVLPGGELITNTSQSALPVEPVEPLDPSVDDIVP